MKSSIIFLETGNEQLKASFSFFRYHQKYGTCYSLDVHHELAKKGITQIVFKTFVNSYIFLHYPGQFMHINSKTKVWQTIEKEKQLCMHGCTLLYFCRYLASSRR